MRDVAAAANVDISTVSKVLSGGNISVRPETRARIEQTVEALGYRPNASARGLRLSRTGTFGMLVPDFTNPVYAQIIRGAVREAETRGRVMLLAELDPGHSPEVYLRLVHERRIDGLLVATARSHSPVLSLLDRDEVPHVFINRRGAARSLSVISDDEEGAAVGTRALIQAGHRRLGLLNGPVDIDTAQRRRAGFERELQAASLPPATVVSRPYSARGGYDAARELLAQHCTRPTGLLVATLTMAIGALAAFAEAGIDIPRDLSVVGFDDGDLASFAHPPLTCVAMPHDQMGAMAVNLLERVVAGEPARSVVVPTPPRLIPRASVAAPPPSRSID
ncbi:MAG TPA: LacI family DNA-binding transcriptional regulator [Solirubrobacteraceae bacterium]|nr:LacI family DNA-binding transcriptional regulator [Solirubrobacteraceae bacterium]